MLHKESQHHLLGEVQRVSILFSSLTRQVLPGNASSLEPQDFQGGGSQEFLSGVLSEAGSGGFPVGTGAQLGRSHELGVETLS